MIVTTRARPVLPLLSLVSLVSLVSLTGCPKNSDPDSKKESATKDPEEKKKGDDDDEGAAYTDGDVLEHITQKCRATTPR